MFNQIFTRKSLRPSGVGPFAVAAIAYGFLSELDFLWLALPLLPLVISGLLAWYFTGKVQPKELGERARAWLASVLSGPAKQAPQSQDRSPWGAGRSAASTVRDVPELARASLPDISDLEPTAAPDQAALELAHEGPEMNGLAERMHPMERFNKHIEEQRARLAKGH